MNKNKLIFAIIGGILVLLIMFIITQMNQTTSGSKTSKGPSDFLIWMIGNDDDGGKKIVENFKKVNSEFKNKKIAIEVFKNYEDYNFALMAAITADKAPDVFVLNNNETNSIFGNQTLGIDPKIINPNDFRKKYKGVFSDDLILSSGEKDQKVEFLKGVPVGYEALGIFYNRRYVKDSELKSLSALNNVVANLKDKHQNLIPIGIGNGSTVYNSSDIMTQFFMLENGVSGLKDISGNKQKQALATYFLFGDTGGYNAYDLRYKELNKLGQTSLDLFSKGETFMVVGYPSMINIIGEKGFSKNFLQASPFPHYFSGDGKTLINYDYFVVNKNTKNKDLAFRFLSYIGSDIGALNFLENYTYYLPALLSLESDKLEEKISDKYNVVLGDFFNSDYELSSFDKGVKSIYDNGLINILDNSSNYENAFDKFKAKITCNINKITTLENLSRSCE